MVAKISLANNFLCGGRLNFVWRKILCEEKFRAKKDFEQQKIWANKICKRKKNLAQKKKENY